MKQLFWTEVAFLIFCLRCSLQSENLAHIPASSSCGFRFRVYVIIMVSNFAHRSFTSRVQQPIIKCTPGWRVLNSPLSYVDTAEKFTIFMFKSGRDYHPAEMNFTPFGIPGRGANQERIMKPWRGYTRCLSVRWKWVTYFTSAFSPSLIRKKCNYPFSKSPMTWYQRPVIKRTVLSGFGASEHSISRGLSGTRIQKFTRIEMK